MIDQYHHDKGKYPASLSALVQEGYLRALPIDPVAQSNSEWVEVQEDLGDNPDPTAQAGIWDVKSGATGQTLDGKEYSEL